eukprot:TRINITY_DN6287_c0_g1_i1.p1 TRINITY_DN6287_c0_g1~~TRINITY_DN6287_c0_g1_i1.p1  ORF type:complete len:587 (-),score=84.94 TRINITY_DN6287_c0_g1_i1:124-1845(-)
MERTHIDVKEFSPLQHLRLGYTPNIPPVLANTTAPCRVVPGGHPDSPPVDAATIQRLFPHTYGQPPLDLVAGTTPSASPVLKIGVVLSGGQAAGGHNVISGLYDYLVARNPHSQLFGFLGGPIGIMKGQYIKITGSLVDRYRNLGGFDIIGTGRDKIETEKQFESSRDICARLELDGLVIIGGDDSNTNAALLAEYFKATNLKTKVVGVPKTIDGDLKSDHGVELSFGFDSAAKVYSELIANIATDARSAGKYYHFIRLMGRSASHITLECALQTHPNIALIGEEVAQKQETLAGITKEVCDIICARADAGKNFGVVIIPEGLIEFIPEVHKLIEELNELLASQKEDDKDAIRSLLSDASRKLYDFLPHDIRHQLMIDRDPHGNVQVSKIETETLLIHLVKVELKARKSAGTFKGSFAALNHFFGYEGRCVIPSLFDCNYCYSLGRTAGALLEAGVTGYMAVVRHVWGRYEDWKCGGVPLTNMMNVERRKGKDKPVIKKALVELDKKPFLEFKKHRARWAIEDCYRNPGPIQYNEAWDEPNITLQLEYGPAAPAVSKTSGRQAVGRAVHKAAL